MNDIIGLIKGDPTMYTNTYHVSGTLVSVGNVERSDRRHIYREIEASDAQAAADSFEINGWEWLDSPAIWLVTEPAKMERLGHPTLFPLPPKETM